ncbi:MAG: 30S ribosomal protein S11 [Gammaproteobacteria bacterium RIFOXYB2_FULL_38_6]|nr:MAG: 30S ribosomal protein S11 [Gammaproteobacteria bacterium RIFOXYB2_FULL_38_6]
MAVKKRKVVTDGIAYIKATFNNTLISITDLTGDVLCQKSAGGCGFKGARKSTPFAAQLVAEEIGNFAKDNFQLKRLTVVVKGPGAARDSAIRALSTKFEIKKLIDSTPVPHNGVRPCKKRRV